MKFFSVSKPDLFYQSTFTAIPSDKKNDMSLSYNEIHTLSYFKEKPTMTGGELCLEFDKTISAFEKAYGIPKSDHPATYENQVRVGNIKQQLPEIMDNLIEKGYMQAVKPEVDMNISHTLC